MTSKSYGWDVRNIAKISPKMVKKGPFFDFRKKYLSRLLYRTCGSGLLCTRSVSTFGTFFRHCAAVFETFHFTEWFPFLAFMMFSIKKDVTSVRNRKSFSSKFAPEFFWGLGGLVRGVLLRRSLNLVKYHVFV